MSYKTIQDNFWSDPKVKSLNYKDRYLFLYLITNSYSHYSGLYHILESTVIEETGMKMDDVKASLYTLHNQNIIRLDPGYSVIWVVNMLRHQVPIRSGISEKVLKGVANHLGTLHHCPLIKDFLEFYVEFDIPYKYETPDLILPNHQDLPAQEPPKRKKVTPNPLYREQAKEIFSYWQTVMNHPDAKYSDGRKVKIENRLQGGYTVDQIKEAIDHCSKSPHHMGKNERQIIYDSIELICRSDEDLERFLHMIKSPEKMEPGEAPKTYDEKTGKMLRLNRKTNEWEETADEPGSQEE